MLLLPFIGAIISFSEPKSGRFTESCSNIFDFANQSAFFPDARKTIMFGFPSTLGFLSS